MAGMIRPATTTGPADSRCARTWAATKPGTGSISSSRKMNSGALAARAAAFNAPDGPGADGITARAFGNSRATASALPSEHRSKETITSKRGPSPRCECRARRVRKSDSRRFRVGIRTLACIDDRLSGACSPLAAGEHQDGETSGAYQRERRGDGALKDRTIGRKKLSQPDGDDRGTYRRNRCLDGKVARELAN